MGAVRLMMVAALLLVGACHDSGSSGDDSAAGGGNGGTGDAGETHTVHANTHTLATPALGDDEFELITLSTFPDAVSGGDVLIALRGLEAAPAPSIALNGEPVAIDLQRHEPSGEFRGLLSGLREGENLIAARLDTDSLSREARLRVVNHPITGPIISGPHQAPFACSTEEAGLGAPLDSDCSVQTQFQWFYRSTVDQQYRELEDPFADYPADTMSTTTRDGQTVPFVVRVESATINRGIARIAVLDDPAARGPDAAFEPALWNRRVYYIFGESCGVGYEQGVNTPRFVLGAPPDPSSGNPVDSDTILLNFVGGAERLGKGDVVVHSTLSAFGVHCNPFVSIETTMMVKEHIAEQYGVPEQFIGSNGSGAALQQYNAANNAPGLLTGALPTATFADIASTAMTVTDCGLLVNYFDNSEFDWSDPAKRAAVTGHNAQSSLDPGPISDSDPSGELSQANNEICQSWVNTFFDRVKPDEGCSVPTAGEGDSGPAFRYHPENNPTGARCTIQDANVNWLGTRPDGFARRPLDNVGVQYGLAALNNGDITIEEFIELNATIGGLDIDGNFVPERHAMDPELAARLYRIGQVIGRGALAETPIMDLAPYLDLIPLLNIHESVRPFTIRARLNRYQGRQDTQTIWRGFLTQPDAFEQIDAWTENLRDMAASGDRANDVASARPADVVDTCSFSTSGGQLDLPSTLLLPLGGQAPLLPTGTEESVPLQVNAPEEWDETGAPANETDPAPCARLLPVVQTPRIVAGMPMTDDVIKCQLTPVDPADYPADMTDEQLDRIRAIFPDGVCDYSQRGVGDLAAGERSMIWPAIGADTLRVDSNGNLAPVELRWRVARPE